MIIAQKLVKEKLIACANIFEPVTSVYDWNGRVEHHEEVVMILKTTETASDKAMERLAELHPHECPAIVAFKSKKGHSDFIKWVENSCKLPY